RTSTVEQRDCMSKLSLREPVRQVKIYTGNKPSLSYTEQEAQDIKMRCCPHKPSQYRHNSPTDQYPRNPDASTELVQEQVARYLKNKIAPKKDARQESELLAR